VGVEANGVDNSSPFETADPLTNSAQQGTASGGADLQFSSGTYAYFGTNPPGTSATVPTTTNPGTSPYTLLIGTITWTDTSLATIAAPAPATVQVGYQQGLTGTINKAVTKYYSDGTLYNESTANANSNMSSGPAVLISSPVAAIPEPASLGLIGLGITSLGVRARRRSVKA
jgi:hypothetical protein